MSDNHESRKSLRITFLFNLTVKILLFCLYVFIQNNMETDKWIEGADILRFIKAQRIKCLGHIQRLDKARPTRKLLDWKPVGTRPVGRPRQRWQKDVRKS